MASLDHRLNSLFSIKECSSCGALYTADFCCSKGGLEDKILVPKPPHNCTTCGDPVEGLYCRPCAFVRKCLNEGVAGTRYEVAAGQSERDTWHLACVSTSLSSNNRFGIGLVFTFLGLLKSNWALTSTRWAGHPFFLLAPLPTRPPVPPPRGAAVDRPALHVVILGGILYTRENMGNVSFVPLVILGSILVLLVIAYGTAVSFAAAYDEYVLLSAKCQENCEFDWLLGARGQLKFVPVVTWTLYRFFYFVPMVSD
ncbi:hypothetical protein Tco_0865828 [Tanacetum coccineum]